MQASQGGSDPQVSILTGVSIADLLAANFKQAFMEAQWKVMSVQGDPGDTMYYEEVRESTDFGQLFHKEGLWSLYKYEECRSLLYHLCRGYKGLKQDNNPAEFKTGRCTSCGSEAPDEIRGLWTLHNFDWIQQDEVD